MSLCCKREWQEAPSRTDAFQPLRPANGKENLPYLVAAMLMRLPLKINALVVCLLFLLAGKGSKGQSVVWEEALSSIDEVRTNFNGGALNLSDTVMVFTGSTLEHGRETTPGSGNIYPRNCLLWVHPANRRPPRLTLIPAYHGEVALCRLGPDLHGMTIDALSLTLGTPRMLYFRFSQAGILLDTVFLPVPAGVRDFTSAAPMGAGRILACSRTYDPVRGYTPWTGLFDVRRLEWVWKKEIPGQWRGAAGASKAQSLFGGRVLVSGHRGPRVFYSIVDSAGPSEAVDLWQKPDTTYSLSQARAWPMPNGGWALHSSGGGNHFVLLDQALQETYHSSQVGIPFTMLSDNGFLVIRVQSSGYSYCRVDRHGQDYWCNPSYPWPSYLFTSALPTDSVGAVLFGTRDDPGFAMSFYFARLSGVGSFYDPAQDSTRFPITSVKGKTTATTLRAWPNPASSVVQLQGMPGKQALLLHPDGRMLLKARLDGNGKSALDLSALLRGLYLLRSDGQVVRVVKE